jgi:hypothetical protein
MSRHVIHKLANKIWGQPRYSVTDIEEVGRRASGACSYGPAQRQHIGHPIVATSSRAVSHRCHQGGAPSHDSLAGVTLPGYRARKSFPVGLAPCSHEASYSPVDKVRFVGFRVTARCADYPTG